MKATLIILLSLFLIFMVFQSFVFRSSGKTEQQKYSVIERADDFEIRYYPRSILATVQMKETGFKSSSYKGFRTLAGYIFGGNAKKESIAMTAPVQMQFSDTSTSMSFVMPSRYSMDDLPAPQNGAVRLHQAEEEYVAVIRYGGYSSDRDIERYTEKLRSILASKNIKPEGSFRYLGYNPPYEVFGRRNEIIVKIQYPY